MTVDPDVVYLAHHGLLLAIPAFVPAFIVAGVIAFIAIRNRRESDDTESVETTKDS